jgi:hypothetical protein
MDLDYLSNEKVWVDTFTLRKHQVKSAQNGALVQKVIATLSVHYPLRIYETPELSAHQDQYNLFNQWGLPRMLVLLYVKMLQTKCL